MVGLYAGKIAKYFGASPDVRALAKSAGYTHDRVRLPSENLLTRGEAVSKIEPFLPPGRRDELAKKFVEEAMEYRKRFVGKVSDYHQTATDKLSSDDLTAALLRGKFLKNNRMSKADA